MTSPISESRNLQIFREFRSELEQTFQFYTDKTDFVSVLKKTLEQKTGSLPPDLSERVRVLHSMIPKGKHEKTIRAAMNEMMKSRIRIEELSFPEVRRAVLRFSEETALREIESETFSQAIELIPERERTLQIRKMLVLLVQKLESRHLDGYFFLEGIESIAPFERKSIIELTFPLLRRELSGSGRQTLLQAVMHIPKNQRREVLEQTQPLLEGITSGYESAAVLDAVGEMSIRHRDDVIEKAGPLCKEILNGHYRKAVLESIHAIPPSQRSDTMAEITPFLSEIEDEGVRITVISILWIFPPECRLSIGLFLRDNPDFMGDDMVSNLLSDPDLGEKVREYLATQLEAEMADPERAANLSEWIIDAQADGLLHIHEEHPLLQRAIEVRSITDPDAVHNSDNPYRIHSDLLQLIDGEPLWTESIPDFVVEGKRMAIDPNGLRKSAVSANGVLEEVSFELFKEIFEGLHRRGRAVSEEIESSYGVSLRELQTSITQGPFIQNLLSKLRAKSDDGVEDVGFHLHAIMRAVSHMSAEIERGELLSPRERAVLVFAHSLRECRIGQLDAIALYYNNLPSEFRVSGKAFTTGEEKLKRFMEAFIQASLNAVFASRELLESFEGSESSSQEAHQTLYLKNRLAKQVGLLHRPVLDAHAGCVEKRFLTASLSLLTERFFRCYTPQKLMKGLQEEIHRSLEDERSGLMLPLTDFFTCDEGAMMYDEEANRVTLTSAGALLLLERFGYVIASKGSDA